MTNNKINLSWIGHLGSEPNTNMTEYIEGILKELNFEIIKDNKNLHKNCINFIFEGFHHNLTKRQEKQILNKKIKKILINTEDLVGNKNINVKLFTSDNFFLKEKKLKKKSVIFDLLILNIFWIFKKICLNLFNKIKNNFLFYKPSPLYIFKWILYHISVGLYSVNHKKEFNNYLEYINYACIWKEWYMKTFKYFDSIDAICCLGTDFEYWRFLSKKLKKKYFFFPLVYSHEYHKKLKKNFKFVHNKQYDIYFSGRLTNYRKKYLITFTKIILKFFFQKL